MPAQPTFVDPAASIPLVGTTRNTLRALHDDLHHLPNWPYIAWAVEDAATHPGDWAASDLPEAIARRRAAWDAITPLNIRSTDEWAAVITRLCGPVFPPTAALVAWPHASKLFTATPEMRAALIALDPDLQHAANLMHVALQVWDRNDATRTPRRPAA